MRVFVPGCAGFLGSSLTDRLLDEGHVVVGIDNFTTGQQRYLERARHSPRFNLVVGNLRDEAVVTAAMGGCDMVFHTAANADIRAGLTHPRLDFEQNTLTTHNVLEAMRVQGVGRIAFCSSIAVYGNSQQIPTCEDAPFPVQTSLYGASKLACEGLISAYCEGFGMKGLIFRCAPVFGERYSHGHVFDFYRQLRMNAGHLDVLGNGLQRKSAVYVQDCIDAMLLARDRAVGPLNIFNIGHQEGFNLKQSIGWICEAMGLTPRVAYSEQTTGWIGDNPTAIVDTHRVRALGWAPAVSIQRAVQNTVMFLAENDWIFNERR
jgi:UDP-glucose 4-epimerase